MLQHTSCALQPMASQELAPSYMRLVAAQKQGMHWVFIRQAQAKPYRKVTAHFHRITAQAIRHHHPINPAQLLKLLQLLQQPWHAT
jgi:hypothetical protein